MKFPFFHTKVDKKFLVLGMLRTGHNAIAKWLLCQHRLVKNVDFKREKSGIERLILSNSNSNIFVDQANAKTDTTINGEIISYACESISIESAYNLAKNFNARPILIVRTFKNWAASSMKANLNYGTKTLSLHAPYVKIAKKHYEEAMNKKSPFYIIKYDKWFVDKKYRKKICKDLKLRFTDIGLQQVPSQGRGSSFDGMEFDNNAQAMSVLNRYKIIPIKIMDSIIKKYPDVVEMSDKIFGEKDESISYWSRWLRW